MIHCCCVCLFAAGFGEEWVTLQEEQAMMDDPAKVQSYIITYDMYVWMDGWPRTVSLMYCACSHAHAHHVCMHVAAHNPWLVVEHKLLWGMYSESPFC